MKNKIMQTGIKKLTMVRIFIKLLKMEREKGSKYAIQLMEKGAISLLMVKD